LELSKDFHPPPGLLPVSFASFGQHNGRDVGTEVRQPRLPLSPSNLLMRRHDNVARIAGNVVAGHCGLNVQRWLHPCSIPLPESVGCPFSLFMSWGCL
jgi:hypothetical protein